MNLFPKTFLLFGVILLSFFPARAQKGSLELLFKLRDENVIPISDVKIDVLLKGDSKLVATYKTGADGNAQAFKLDLFNEYILVFSKEGFVTRKMWIDANVTGKEHKINLYYYYQKLVYLYAPSSKLSKADVPDKPYCKFIYLPSKDEFSEDTKYAAALKDEAANLDQQPKQSQAPASDKAKSKMISGKIYSGKPATTPLGNASIELLDEKGNIIETVVSNQFGRFNFSKSMPGKNYKIHITPQQKVNNMSLLSIWLDDLIVISPNDKGEFSFTLLDSDKATISMLEVDDDAMAISGNLLAILNGANKPLANKKVTLVNDKGETIESSTTNAFGTFTFSKFASDKNFSIRIDEKEPLPANTKIIMTNKVGNEIASASSDKSGKSQFEFQAENKKAREALVLDDTELKIDITGFILTGANKTPYSNKKIGIANETGKVIQTAITDAKGHFDFKNLNADQKHLITLEDGDISLQSKFFIADEKGKVVKECSLNKNDKGFKFRLLPSDQKQLGTAYVDDPWLDVLQLKSKPADQAKDIIITERIYFNFNESAILPEAQNVLDKIVQVMNDNQKINIELAAHTDTKGKDEYNMELSKKRAQNAVAYLVSKGIAATRLKSIGYGETRPIIKCPADNDCTEADHSLNRRIEFKVSVK